MDENKTYSAEDMLRYAHGQMPAAERHALEKAALDDAFLAEALEGYIQTTADRQQTTEVPELNKLKQIIAGKAADKNEKRHVPVISFFNNKFLQRAVAAVLLFGTAWWLYSISNKPKEAMVSTNTKQIAQVHSSASMDSTTINTAPKQTQPLVLEDKTTVKVEPEKKQVIAAAPIKIETIDKKKPAPTMAPVTVADSVATQKDMALSETATAEKRSSSQPYESRKIELAKNMAVGYASPQKLNPSPETLTLPKKTAFVFKGRMVDANNNALPFSSVTVPGEDFGTYTDVQGYFNFVYSDSILPIHAKSLGFEPQDVNLLASKKENRIVLNEDKNLDKNLTFLRFAKQKKAIDYKPTIIKIDSISSTVEPFVGWKNYDLYLANNNRISDYQSSNNRTVLLSFEVGQAGDVKNITVDKSQGKDLDAEAIRLLKEGPKWKVRKIGEKGKVEVTF